MSRPVESFRARMLHPIISRLLKSRFHPVLSSSVLVLRIPTHGSEKAKEVPVRYAPRGPYLDIFPPPRWVKHLESTQCVELLLRGTRCNALVRAERNPMAVGKALRRFLRAVPREAATHRVKIRRGLPDAFGIARAAEDLCWIELDVQAGDRLLPDRVDSEVSWVSVRSRPEARAIR